MELFWLLREIYGIIPSSLKIIPSSVCGWIGEVATGDDCNKSYSFNQRHAGVTIFTSHTVNILLQRLFKNKINTFIILKKKVLEV